MKLPEFIGESADYLRQKGAPDNIEAAVILGSGLGEFASTIKNSSFAPYADIPHFPEPSVKGHAGKFIWGEVEGKNIIAFSGRFHHYEGFTFQQAALPVYIANLLGAKKLLISNAAGAVNTAFDVGELMIIDSVIRQNTFISPPAANPYRCGHFMLAKKAQQLAAQLKLSVQKGTYLYAKGPNYETKAEIRAFRRIGAYAVGMSTVPELFEAARLKLQAVAVSLISNMAAGIRNHRLNHAEVKQAAKLREADFARLICKLIAEL
jgi:purine-nucleoside phosphorylase